MKEIEKQLLSIMTENKDIDRRLTGRDRVQVKHLNTDVNYIHNYFLWDSNIYSMINSKTDIREVFSLCGWDTVTARSRLNALLTVGNVSRINGKTYYINNKVRILLDKNKKYMIMSYDGTIIED